jgi:DNA-3-methyladenine glycosylase I
MNRLPNNPDKIRCGWVPEDNDLYIHYHDEEWGVAVHDDQKHFEMLILEGAQAGLSWLTVLQKRENYREAFHSFDPEKVANMSDAELELQLQNPGIIRNRLKVFAARKNAIAFLKIRDEFSSFDKYVWGFVGGKQKVNTWKNLSEVPASTPDSDALAKDLKKRGMTFVGTTIIYAYMQAVGMVNDHTINCWRYKPCIE